MSNKTDKESEKGCRWWLRYIIVPLTAACVGGGGIVAIIVALIPVVFPTPPIPTTVTIPPGAVAASTPTATPISPTNTPVPPTDTPTTEPPTSTLTPTHTATPQPRCKVDVGVLNLREGPSTQFHIISKMTNDMPFEGVKRTSDAVWVFGNSPKASGWAWAAFLDCTYDLGQLPVAEILPPTYTPTLTDTPTPTNTPTDIPVPPPELPTSAPPEPPTHPPTETPTPTPIPPPFIGITAPEETLACVNPEEWCEFEVRGDAGGVSSFSDLRIYTFVRPVDPPGPGWYLQDICADINADGSWVQFPSVLGDLEYPASDGDTLRIRAALVQEDATFQGKKLSDFSQGKACLDAVEEIEGFVALSDVIELTVQR